MPSDLLLRPVGDLTLLGLRLDPRDTTSPQFSANVAKLQKRLYARLVHLYRVLSRHREEAADPLGDPAELRKGTITVRLSKL